MDDGQAIFRSTSQALHFAYLIEAYEASAESIMAKVLRIHMMEFGIWDDGVPSTVNFGGLNALEVRAQCAMIRAAVRDRLPGPEAWAVQARYGRHRQFVIFDGREERKPFFSSERKNAILNLGDYFAPSFRNFNRFACRVLVARAANCLKPSFHEMAQKFGGDHSTYAYAMKRMVKAIDTLERLAIDRLNPVFVADGVVEC